LKFNLKNFPEPIDGLSTVDELKYKIWKEAFEKELREQLAYGEKSEKAWRGAKKHRVDEELAMEWQGANHKIKEILGEA